MNITSIEVEITDSHIQRGHYGSGLYCPIALALTDLDDIEEAIVTGPQILIIFDSEAAVNAYGIEKATINCNGPIVGWIKQFDDKGHEVQPFRLHIDLENDKAWKIDQN